MKTAQLEAIRKHGEQLLAIFPNATERDPVKLCKKLRRLELKANAIALRLCNGPEFPGGYDQVDAAYDAILRGVRALLVDMNAFIHINRDPRGYALKISDTWVSDLELDIHRDMGGYGIIAPEITG